MKLVKKAFAVMGIFSLGVLLFFLFLPYGVYIEYHVKFNPIQAWSFVATKAPIEYAINASEADQGLTGNGRTIKAFVDAIGGTRKATIKVLHTSTNTQTTHTLTTSETVSSNIAVEVDHGAILDGAGTLTINGPFEAGLGQCFGSSITITFGNGAVKEVYPEWWGAWPDDTTECASAIQAAHDSGTAKIVSQKGTYKISSTLTGFNAITLSGVNDTQTIWKFYNVDGIETATGAQFIVIEDMYFQLNGYPKDKTGIKFIGTDGSHTAYHSIRHSFFRGWNECIIGQFCWGSGFDDIMTMDCNQGIQLYGQSVNNTISNSEIHADTYCIYAVRQDAPEKRPEGLMIVNSLIYGLSGVGIYFAYAQYNSVVGCIIDGTFTKGISNLGSADLRIIGNWIACSGDGSYGIHLADLGAAKNMANKIIGNEIVGLSNADRGIHLGANCNRNIIIGNEITGFDHADIYVETTSLYNNIDNNILLSASPAYKNLMLVGSYNNVVGNQFPTFRIHDDGDYNSILGNTVSDGANCLVGTGTGNVIRNNMGYKTENSGTATLLNANTTVVVAHGLIGTPTVINIAWRENPDNVIADWWVDTIGAANFTLNGVDPGASNLDFGWSASIY